MYTPHCVIGSKPRLSRQPLAGTHSFSRLFQMNTFQRAMTLVTDDRSSGRYNMLIALED